MKPHAAWTLLVVAALLAGVSWRPDSRAQEPRDGRAGADPAASGNVGIGRVTLDEALVKPMTLPFDQDTPLEAVAARLQQELRAPVVLDRAALGRRELTPESTVKLRLEGVRLKTGLKLLLDQVGLTYKVVAEDNLLILTDAEGAEDPSERIFDELKAIRRDLDQLRHLVDDLNASLAPMEEVGPEIRKPTIIEELPGEKPPGADKDEARPARSRPGL